MQPDDPGQGARPEAVTPQHQQQQQQPPPGGSGQGAASAYERMKLLRDDLAGRQPVEPLPDVEPP